MNRNKSAHAVIDAGLYVLILMKQRQAGKHVSDEILSRAMQRYQARLAAYQRATGRNVRRFYYAY